MKTLVDIDDKLMKEAMEATGIRQKKALVHHALTEIVRRNRIERLIAMAGRGALRVTWRQVHRQRWAG